MEVIAVGVVGTKEVESGGGNLGTKPGRSDEFTEETDLVARDARDVRPAMVVAVAATRSGL